jgi:two-component system chemotaxis response regulator CheB
MSMPMSRTKVLIVDDSAVVRQVLKELLSGHDDIEVMATVADPIFAMKRMGQSWPDVILLDLEMPRMDGMTFLKKIMQERPTPVVICSSHTEKGADVTLEALKHGAVSIMTKPRIGSREQIEQAVSEVLQAVRAASQASVSKALSLTKKSLSQTKSTHCAMKKTAPGIIAIGASTGGTQAIELILSGLPVSVQGIVIVQHMPAHFTALFARRLNDLCAIEVREATDGEKVRPGTALIAPGGKHVQIKIRGNDYYIHVFDAEPVNRHKPSVDVLFHSLAANKAKDVDAYLLTGMGDDGARGLLSLKNAGAYTVAQDEESSVVFGMPKAAIGMGAANQVMSLDQILQQIVMQSTRAVMKR